LHGAYYAFMAAVTSQVIVTGRSVGEQSQFEFASVLLFCLLFPVDRFKVFCTYFINGRA